MTPRKFSQAEFQNQATHKNIGFMLPAPPDTISPEESLALRTYMKSACESAGFLSSASRLGPLSSKILKGVKKGDGEAWRQFLQKHNGLFSRCGEHYLGNGDNPTILDGEDIVQDVLFALLKKDGFASQKSPQANIQYKIMSRALSAGRDDSRYYRKNSAPIADDRAQPEYDGMVETLALQLPEILDEAKKQMTERQREVLAVIRDSKTNLSLEDVGRELTPKITGERVSQHMDKIIPIILQTAHALGYEETAAAIEGLMRINNAEESIRR